MRTTTAIEQAVRKAISSAQEKGDLPATSAPIVKIEKPKLAEHGDFSTSVPLTLARSMRMDPKAIGAEIIKSLPDNPIIGRSWVAPPGFVNFSLSDDWLIAQIDEIKKTGFSYGSSDYGQGKHVQVEFVSVNPTGPLHVGHARGAVLGSGIANVLEQVGYIVQREYYVNDAGAQMQVFYETLHARYMQASGKKIDLPNPSYPGEYLISLAEQLYLENPDLVDLNKDQIIAELGPKAVDRIIENIKNVLSKLNIKYDAWFYESSLISNKTMTKVLDELGGKNIIIDRDGAKWFRTTLYGQAEDDVVIRSKDSIPTYFGTDLAYHYDKFRIRKFDRVINVWGADHHGHVDRLKAAVEAIGIAPENLTVVLNQIVSFRENGESVRFSKRKGVIFTVEELLGEVGPDACRFIFLSRSPTSQMEFDLALATRQSSENPVYYVQYAHARLASIVKSAKELKITSDDADLNLLSNEPELELLRRLIEFPEVIHRAAIDLEPHHVPNYALELARTFQRFYEQCRVLSEDQSKIATSKARLALIEAAKIVLAKTLNTMGMSAPNRM